MSTTAGDEETKTEEARMTSEEACKSVVQEGSEDECQHYKRFCKLKAPCCSVFYSCRFCHDESNNHEMNRHKVQEIQCKKCSTIQAVRKNCEGCGIEFGEYFCQICRLYDKDNEQFHCDKCGICRVGPRSKFYHCDRCNACLSKDLEGKHKCVENVSYSCCPICREYLHTSRSEMQIPKCGHMLHRKCLDEYYQQRLYQCPICKESLFDMGEVWKEMDDACASVVIPEDLRHITIKILCQDCHKHCEQLFNTEGLKCMHCGGYNTTQE